MTTMRMRSILLGGSLGLGTLLAGCPFEDPPVIDDSESSGVVDPSTGGVTSTTPTTTMVPPTSETATEVTTVDLTTMGSLDDTTVGITSADTTAAESSSSSSDGDVCVAACSGIACDMVDGCDCGECGPMATCSDDQTYCGLPVGFNADFGDEYPINGQVQFGFRFSVFEATSVRRLGVISAGAGTTVRLALYDHDGVGPANRLVQTGAVMLYANGNNEYDVGATPIAPGDYWVMLHTEGATPLTRTFNGDNMYESAYRTSIPFASGFPATMDDETVATDYRYNLYMIVEE